jgi:LPXTG-motif cell wall-anchored protein
VGPALGAALAAVATMIAGAGPAHAAAGTPVNVNSTCLGYYIFATGATGPIIQPGLPFPLSTTVAAVGGPTEVNAGASFSAIAGNVAVPIPGLVDTKLVDSGIGLDTNGNGVGDGVVPVFAASNIILTIKVSGAAAIGTPTLAGGDVSGPTAEKSGADTVVVKLPGTRATVPGNFSNGSGGVVPGNEKQFDPNSEFASPQITIPVTAGAAGTAIKFEFVKFQVDSDVDVTGGGVHVPARAICDPDANVLGAVQVVTPPPPGAPDAVADVTQTDAGKPVTIDVLANDVPDAELPIDPDSLEITTKPAHGTAVVNADHTVTYTPASGYSGGDTFAYRLCSMPPEEPAPTTSTTSTSVPEVAAAVANPCDTAKVTITVIAPPPVTPEAPPAPPATTPEPTVAPEAEELPRTGSGSWTLAFTGAGLSVLGLAASAWGRRRRPGVNG